MSTETVTNVEAKLQELVKSYSDSKSQINQNKKSYYSSVIECNQKLVEQNSELEKSLENLEILRDLETKYFRFVIQELSKKVPSVTEPEKSEITSEVEPRSDNVLSSISE